MTPVSLPGGHTRGLNSAGATKTLFFPLFHRAVMNPRCQPWPLPSDRYTGWRTITFNFDPRDY